MAQQASVLSTDTWYKISVASNGIFKMDYNFLKSIGINPDQIDPRKIKLFGGSVGMLPQLNSTARIADLQELAIFIAGETDGKFNSEDYVLFYGQDADDFSFDLKRNIFNYKNNLYSDKNFYFITVADTQGKRLAISESLTTQAPIINQFDDLGYYETDKYNVLASGRDFFGEQFDSKTDITVRFDIAGIVDNAPIKLVSNVMAQAFDGASFKVFFNNKQVAEQAIDAIPNTSYGLKGRETIDTVSFNSTTVAAATQSNQDIKYQYIKTGTSRSIGYLDYFLFSFQRKLALYGSQTVFRSAASVMNSTSTFQINALPEDAFVWDVSDNFNVKIQNRNIAANTTFTTATTALKTFVVFKNDGLASPINEGTVANQNLHAMTDVDFIIITHPNFKTQALRLADHRTANDGLSTKVVTVQEVYNEYAGGKQDITALRDFIKDVYYRSNKRLSNVLLFGRCSYDYKDIAGATNTNYVPTFESVNSLSPLETYSSDDYFTFLEPSEGEWTEYPALDHTMDIGIGRLSVTTLQEAQDVVDKLVVYNDESTHGAWQQNIVFVADDGDYNIHQGQADQLATTIDSKQSAFNAKKIYLDAFTQITKPNGQTSPDTKAAIIKAISEGTVILNYTGHGSENVWMQEQVLDGDEIKDWKNGPRYPLFVTATCEFGRHDNPFLISSGEKILLQKKGGGIGLVTTSRPVYSSSNFTINQAFYDALFVKENGKYKTLGVIFKDTKNNSISGVSNRNFSLLGDPSMRLAFAENQIVINSIKTKNNSDTLKALSTVVIKGVIKSGSQSLTNFNGTVEATLLDKQQTQNTLGDENPVFAYTTRDNALFRGKASVTQGAFQLEFIVPKNIESAIGNSKLSLFATSSTGLVASGGTLTIKLGLSETGSADTTAPFIKLFMGDTSYVSGGLVGPNTTLVAKLQDVSGINISNRIASKNLQAVIDDTVAYIVNDYYLADKDTYASGTVSFPIAGLTKGKHTIKFTASDTYNNTSTSAIDFIVTDGTGIQVDQFYTYPNPFNPDRETATFQFVHSRPGEDLEASIKIFDMTGQLQQSDTFSIAASQYRVLLTEWNGTGANGNKLASGIYLARLSVRSLLDGSKNEQSTRLIILN
jgi:hypothetical protein